MFNDVNKSHWEHNWKGVRTKSPLSLLNVFNYDAVNLLKSKLLRKERNSVVEIGFAPGKLLSYIHHNHGALCYGYDYSEIGCNAARDFLDSQHCREGVEIFCQDVLESPPLATHQANLVYSIGVVEHFADPSGMIRAHLNPMAPNGVCVIILPNYTGFNYKIQRYLDSSNIDIHNLESMTPIFWGKYAQRFPDYDFRTYTRGHMNPWMFSLQKYGRMASVFQLALNFLCFLLPPNISKVASMFVVEIRKR